MAAIRPSQLIALAPIEAGCRSQSMLKLLEAISSGLSLSDHAARSMI
jgi:hypothetical protein